MEPVDIRRDTETYCNLMNAYLMAQIAELDATLQQNGIEDQGIRKSICAQFGMSMGQVFDLGWIGVDGERFHPLLMFSEKYLDDAATPIGEVGPLEGPTREDDFHAMAVEAVSTFYDDLQGDLSRVAYGTLDEELL